MSSRHNKIFILIYLSLDLHEDMTLSYGQIKPKNLNLKDVQRQETNTVWNLCKFVLSCGFY